MANGRPRHGGMFTRRRRAFALGCVTAGLALPAAAGASRLDPPVGSAMLVVSGSIGRTTDGVAALFDRAMLEALAPPTAIGSEDARVIPLEALLAFLGGDGARIEARSLDDDRLVIPTEPSSSSFVLVVPRPSGDAEGTLSLAEGRFDDTGRFTGEAVLERVVRLRIE
ncbi:MAG: hypothetical protein WD673_01620 [Alphaproteobacteria bacterium]